MLTKSIKLYRFVLRSAVLTIGLFAQVSDVAEAQVRPAEEHCELVYQLPAAITKLEDGALLIDYGRVAFGNLLLTPSRELGSELVVHFGEKLLGGRVDRLPPGTVRYCSVATLPAETQPRVVAPKPDQRNTQQGNSKRNLPPAVLTPEEWGVVVPFRWVEVEGWAGEAKPSQFVRRAAFLRDWQDEVASFRCSNSDLNEVWQLCRYSIKATLFAGVYVDGDRERIPYEADAYLNQLSHYATDDDIQTARRTFEWLEEHPTWPADWTQHMVLIAFADWQHTGDSAWLAQHYQQLQGDLLWDLERADGLLEGSPRMVVDWPKTERDGFVFTQVNVVLNAFHAASLQCMAEIAEAVGKPRDAQRYRAKFDKAIKSFQKTFFDESTGLYVDGVGTNHSSAHANLFPLALGLVPEGKRQRVASWLASRGMSCSVYAAQYLLDGLFENGFDQQAVELMVAPSDRSWHHMLKSGTTITWEAWDQKYKPNQDWNHAWGAAPANLLPRHVLGVQPREPGWESVRISPKPGGLQFAEGKVPTPCGPIEVCWNAEPHFRLEVKLPGELTAFVDLPLAPAGALRIYANGKPANYRRSSGRCYLTEPVSGETVIEYR